MMEAFPGKKEIDYKVSSREKLRFCVRKSHKKLEENISAFKNWYTVL